MSMYLEAEDEILSLESDIFSLRRQVLEWGEVKRQLEFRNGVQELEIIKLKKEIKEWKRQWSNQFDVDAMGGS